MQNERSAFEVVEVLTECRLRDAEHREHMYWRRDGGSLAPGFYVVSWPRGAAVGRFHEDAVFRGPLSRDEAAAALQRLNKWAEAGPVLEQGDEAVRATQFRSARLKAYRRAT